MCVLYSTIQLYAHINPVYLNCRSTMFHSHACICFIILRENTQGVDPLHGIPRAKLEVFPKMIHLLCFLPKDDIINMYPNQTLADLRRLLNVLSSNSLAMVKNSKYTKESTQSSIWMCLTSVQTTVSVVIGLP